MGSKFFLFQPKRGRHFFNLKMVLLRPEGTINFAWSLIRFKLQTF